MREEWRGNKLATSDVMLQVPHSLQRPIFSLKGIEKAMKAGWYIIIHTHLNHSTLLCEKERDRITTLKQFKVHGHRRRDKRINLFSFGFDRSILFNNSTWHHHTYHNGTSKQTYMKRHSILLLHIYLYFCWLTKSIIGWEQSATLFLLLFGLFWVSQTKQQCSNFKSKTFIKKKKNQTPFHLNPIT